MVLFFYKDSIFGTIPLRVYVPENYQYNVSSPAVLILHGAVVLSSFKDAYKDTATDEDVFYSYFSKHNFIIISPVMVNLQNPIIVNVNGKEVFNKRIAADKAFLLKNFASTFDRKALWIASIKIKTN